MSPPSSILVTGVSGDLAALLLPLLPEHKVYGVDVRPLEAAVGLEFEKADLGVEDSCRGLIEILRKSRARTVIHLAFLSDQVPTVANDLERMWQINVAGTARVMEAISVVNRTGGTIRQFITTSSGLVYGPAAHESVTEDSPLLARTLLSAVHKREADAVVRYRAESLGDCCTYLLRPSFFAGPSAHNYAVGLLRGNSWRKAPDAKSIRERGQQLPLIVPMGRSRLENELQFVHLNDMARLLAYIVRRPASDPAVTVLNVAAKGEPVTIRRCAEIARARIRRVPHFAICNAIQRSRWKRGVSTVPPESLPYVLNASVLDTSRLLRFLGRDYNDVIRCNAEEALQASFADA